ncbi:hypothetical protein ACHAWF_014074 [Thalassiosira exigua]
MTGAASGRKTPAETPPAFDSEDSLAPRRWPAPDEPMCDPGEAMEQLNVELGRLRENKLDIAFPRAHALQPKLFDDDHKMAFLHTEDYNVKVSHPCRMLRHSCHLRYLHVYIPSLMSLIQAATDRLVSYWEARADLFGDNRMLLPMNKSGTLKDIDSLALDRGIFQVLPQKDTEGRALIFYDPSRHDPKLGYSTKSMVSNLRRLFPLMSSDHVCLFTDSLPKLRVLWYLLHVMMEDTDTLENGFVVIVYPKHCTPEQIDRHFIAKAATIIANIVPLRWNGFHICHPCSSYNKFFPLVKMLSPDRMKDSVVVHFGTNEEVLEYMSKYSLTADRLPKDFGGGQELDYSNWISERKLFEGEDALRVSTPRPDSPQPESSDELMENHPLSPQTSVRSGSSSAPSTASVGAKPKAKRATATGKRSASTASPSSPNSTQSKPAAAAGKPKRPGRKGDARMHRAVTAKMETSALSLVDALQSGGFTFEGLNDKGKPHHEIFDQDGVSLMQRKNQLLRRVRVEKKKMQDQEECKE